MKLSLVALVFALAIVIAACTSNDPVTLDPGPTSSPSSTTATSDTPTSNAPASGNPVDEEALPIVFADPTGQLTEAELAAFIDGQELFDVEWTPSGEGDEATDGLGPLFNASSCAACHPSTGRRQVPPQGELTSPGLIVRLSIGSDPVTGAPTPDPTYGDQLQDLASGDGEGEASVFTNYVVQQNFFGDGTLYEILWPVNIRDRTQGPLTEGIRSSARIGSQLAGMGLLEAVPDEQILALADPNDANGDGISGRPNGVWNPRTEQIELGRFGWKANVVELDQQIAGAFHGDMGLTTSRFPNGNCTDVQDVCPDSPTPEVSDEQLAVIGTYVRGLVVPEPRELSEEAEQGQQHFRDFGCASCHTETLTTGDHPIEALANQTIRPYTDMLLHDLGGDMADNRPDFGANGVEWRTAPLWGLGLVPVEGDRGLLHDGRARTIEEAILWHGGEGARSRAIYINAELQARAELIAFLETL